MGCFQNGSGLPARHVLCVLLFLGFFMAFMLRVNLSVAIVIMVRASNNSAAVETLETSAACAVILDSKNIEESIHINNTDEAFLNASSVVYEPDEGEFEWDEVSQGLILGAFFWGYLISQVPGGRIAEVYGPRLVFGFSVLINAVLCIILPSATRMHWVALLIIRALQGLAQGSLFPCLNAAVATWCPIDERDRFISFAVQGATIGAVVSLPLCGLVGSALGWDAIFYTSGCLALVWCVAWFFLVSDTPDRHPKISEKELTYLAKNIPARPTEVTKVPWLQALMSPQFLIGCIAAVGNDYGFHTLLTFAPKYMKSALGCDLQQNTLISSIPFLSQYVFAMVYGVIMDKLLSRGVQLVLVRKISVCFSHLLPALGLLVLSYTGCNVVASVAVLTFSVAVVGAFTCGFFQNPLDIAPNYAGSLTGIMNMLGSLTGIVASPVAGFALHTYGAVSGWRTIFLISACTYGVTALPYLALAKCRIQPWNNVPVQENNDAEVPMHDVAKSA